MKNIIPKSWELHFTRFRCPLIAAAVQGGWSRFTFPVENIIVNSSEVYFNKKQYQKCVRLFAEKNVQEPNYLLNLSQQAYDEFQRKKGELEKLESIDFKAFSDVALLSTFHEWFEWLYQWNAHYIPPPTLAEEFLTLQLQQGLGRYVDPLHDFERFQELQLLCTTPARPGFLEQYEVRIAQLAQKVSPAEEDLTLLAYEYGWLGDPGRLENFWDVHEIKKQFLAQKATPSLGKKNVSVIDALTSLGADAKFKKTVSLVREYVYFRTFRMDVNQIFCYRARFLFKEMARRIYVPLNSFTYMSSYEIVSSLQGGITPADLHQRKKDFAIILSGTDIDILTAEKSQKLTSIFSGVQESSINELHGTTACTGIAQGMVKLVFTNADVAKVTEGDVLVSPMTKPEFLMAMKKASAIVTDEGGITCHAAIVSRELDKPCIIGTKTATKVFKDGDIVAIDASRGIIKKI